MYGGSVYLQKMASFRDANVKYASPSGNVLDRLKNNAPFTHHNNIHG